MINGFTIKPRTELLNRRTTWLALFSSLTILEFWITYEFGITHDHVAYVNIWSRIQNGQSPYGDINPYGPLMYLMGFLFGVSPLAPKLFMFVSYQVSIATILVIFFKLERSFLKRTIFFVIIKCNALTIGIVSFWGLNDTWVAAMCGLSALAFMKDKRALFVLFISLAASMKIYALAVPLFIGIKSRLEFQRYVVPTFVFSSLIYFVTFVQFGLDFMKSMFFIGSRSSSLLSPFEPLKKLVSFYCESTLCESVYRPLIITFIIGNFLLMIIGTLIIIHLCRIFRLSNFECVNLGMVTLLSLYQAVHPQFFVTWTIFYALLLMNKRQESRLLLVYLAPIFCFMNFFQFVNLAYQESTLFGFIYHFGGAIYFPIFGLSVVLYFRRLKSLAKSK